MREDFVTVPMYVSRMALDIHVDALNRFLRESAIYSVTAEQKQEEKQDEVTEEADFGTDLELLEGEDSEMTAADEPQPDEDIREQADSKEWKPELNGWQSWQNTITHCIISLRKAGCMVTRITRTRADRRREVVLLVRDASDAHIREIFAEQCQQAEIPVVVKEITDPLSLKTHEIVNLLFGLVPYHYTQVPDNQYPYGGYQVFADENKSNDPSKWPDKCSFATVYLDRNGLLRCALKPYYRRGSWLELLSETQQLESKSGMIYRVAPTGQDDFLTRGCETDGAYTDIYYLSRYMDRILLKNRVANPDAKKRAVTKQVIMDRALFRFNETFGDLITMAPEQWNVMKHWSEVTNTEKDPESGEKRNGGQWISERQMEAVNYTRTIIEEGGGFAVVSSMHVAEEQKKFVDVVAPFIRAFYNNAMYGTEVSVKKNAGPAELFISATQGERDDSYTVTDAYAVCSYTHTMPDGTEIPEKKAIIRSEATDGGLKIILPGKLTGNPLLSVFIQRPYDMPLRAQEPFRVLLRDESGSEKQRTRSISYKKGFGVENGTVHERRQADDELTICLLPDNVTQAYKEEKRLSAQHFGLIDAKDKKRKWLKEGCWQDPAFLSKCQKTMYELAIRQALLDGEIMARGNVQSALYAFYVPSKRKKHSRTKAHYRYFLYDESGIQELRFEDLKNHQRDFPRLFEFLEREEPRLRQHRYFIKTSTDTYYLWQTDMTAMGNSEIGPDGMLKEFPGKGTEPVIENMPGGVGVTFYHEERHLEDIIYYCSAGFPHPKDVQVDGWQNAPHIYEVHHDRQDMEPDYHDLWEMLTDPLIKLNQYTVRPSIFKYLDESQKCSGRR